MLETGEEKFNKEKSESTGADITHSTNTEQTVHSPDMEHVRSCLSELKGKPKCYIEGTIPDQKIIKFSEKLGVSRTEKFLGLIDDSMALSVEGVVFTDNGVYSREAMEASIFLSYKELTESEIDGDFGIISSKIIIRKGSLEYKIKLTEKESAQILFNILKCLKFSPDALCRDELNHIEKMPIATSCEATPNKNKVGLLLDNIKHLIRNFFVPIVVKSIGYSILLGIVFFIAGVAMCFWGLALFPPNINIWVKVLVVLIGIVIAIIYGWCGVAWGLIWGAISGIQKKSHEVKGFFNQIVEPLTQNIIERIPLGKKEISTSEFKKIVDEKFADFLQADNQRKAAFSITDKAYRFITLKIFNILHSVIFIDFIESVQQSKSGSVNIQSLERFAREGMVSLVINRILWKLKLMKMAVWGCSAVLLIPCFILFIL